MNTPQQNLANAQAWSALAFAALASGADVPGAPASLPTNTQAALKALPDWVKFDPANTGAVNFTNAPADKANVPYFWIGALASLAPGSQQYANVAYNTQTEEFTDETGWFPQPAREMLPLAHGLLTGLPEWDTQNGPVFTPTVHNIPTCIDTVDKALEFLADPTAAFKKYRPHAAATAK